MMKIWDILKREAPTCVDEINLSLQNCIDIIENTRNLLNDKSTKYTNLDKNEESKDLLNSQKKLLEIIDYLKSVKDDDIPEYTQKETVTDAISVPTKESDKNEKYWVDPSKPHKLSEDFTNTKPCAFKLRGNKKHIVNNFNDILFELCKILYEKDQTLFKKIAKDHQIKSGKNGTVIICFDQDEAAKEVDKKKCVYIPSSNIFVFTGINNRTKVDAIRKLLSAYHISENSFSIFLKWDKRINNGKLLNVEYDYMQASNAQSKIKVAQLAYDYFEEYFRDTKKYYNIEFFLNDKWCSEVLGISCPLLKEVNINKNLKEQTIYGDKNYPSYAQSPIYNINGKDYIIYMRWSKSRREKLKTWITEQATSHLEHLYSKKKQENKVIFENTEKYEQLKLFPRIQEKYEQLKLFPNIYKQKKEDCIYYDFKNNRCMCMQSGMFTLQCKNTTFCKYYTLFALHIIPKSYCTNKRCPHCNDLLEQEMIHCTYRSNDMTEVNNKLISYKCYNCDINYVSDTLFKQYTHSKNLEDLSITFINEELE